MVTHLHPKEEIRRLENIKASNPNPEEMQKMGREKDFLKSLRKVSRKKKMNMFPNKL